jgi:hypothetical protein
VCGSVVVAAIVAERPPVAGTTAPHQAEVTPAAVPAVKIPAEVLLIRTAVLRQDAMAVNSSRPGSKPASSHHRQEAPQGASCSSRAGGDSLRVSTKQQQGSLPGALSRARELK